MWSDRRICLTFYSAVFFIAAMSCCMCVNSTHLIDAISSPPQLNIQQGIEGQALDATNKYYIFGALKPEYTLSDNYLEIVDILGEAGDAENYKTEIKNDCFYIQQGIWQAKLSTDTVDVEIEAPFIDKNGAVTDGLAGSCTLHRAAAAKIVWSNLDYNTAWEDSLYSNQYMHQM